MTRKKPFQILREHFERKKMANPGYSIRSLARDLKLSQSFMTSIFSGKKAIPIARLQAIAQRLSIDELALSDLRRSILLESMPAEQREEVAKSTDFSQAGKSLGDRFHFAPTKELPLLQNWQNIAILDLSTCHGFKADIQWIAAKLSIPTKEASRSLDFLITNGYLVEGDGGFQKNHEALRFPVLQSRQEIRNYHRQMMIKAIETMQKQHSNEQYRRRLIGGLSIAADPGKIAEAKLRLERAVHEVAEFLSGGECSEVFHLGFQLFPLTNGKKE